MSETAAGFYKWMQVFNVLTSGGSGFVSGIIGTENEVLANGTFGTPESGDVTLTISPNYLSSPLAIGNVTPNTGNFTALVVSDTLPPVVGSAPIFVHAIGSASATVRVETLSGLTNQYSSMELFQQSLLGTANKKFFGIRNVTQANNKNYVNFSRYSDLGTALTDIFNIDLESDSIAIGSVAFVSNTLISILHDNYAFGLVLSAISKTSVDNFQQGGILSNSVFLPSSSCTDVFGISSTNIAMSPAAGAINNAVGLKGKMIASGNLVTNLIGTWGETSTQSGGTNTRGFSVYGAPVPVGTYRASGAFAGGILVGAAYGSLTTTVNPPTSGALFEGNVSIGASTAASLFNVGTANAFQINTAGSVVAGLWAATKISEVFGGTNQSTYTLGDLLYSSSANTLSKLAGQTSTTKQFLSQLGNGTISAAPAWNTITFTDVAGINTLAKGGTGTSNVFPTGYLVYAGASGVYSADSNLFFDAASKILSVGSSSPPASARGYFSSVASNTELWINSPTANLVNLVFGKNGVSVWQMYVPALSSELRFYDSSDRIIFSPGGSALFSGDITTNGNLIVNTIGKTLAIRIGSSGMLGDTIAMVAGTVTVSVPSITTDHRVFYNRLTTGGTVGNISIVITAGVGFTLTSSSSIETSTFCYVIFLRVP